MKKLIIFTIISLVAINCGFSQSNASSTEKKVPTLYGHTFPSVGQFRSSFIQTSLLANLSIGSTSTVIIPGITIGDNQLFDFTGKILFLNMNVTYQQRFTPWLALYLSIKMAGRLGTDMSTILVDGVNTVSGGDIGWMIRIKQSKRLNLSGSINVSNLTGNFINVSEYIEEIINNNPSPKVIKKVPAMSIGVGILGAYAFNPTYGLQFHAEYAYGESFERNNTTGYFITGVTGDMDFLPKYNAPVGLSLGYTLTSAPEIVMSEGGLSSIFTGKVMYTGSDDFELGLKFSYYNVDVSNVEETSYVSQISLLLKFYF